MLAKKNLCNVGIMKALGCCWWQSREFWKGSWRRKSYGLVVGLWRGSRRREGERCRHRRPYLIFPIWAKDPRESFWEPRVVKTIHSLRRPPPPRWQWPILLLLRGFYLQMANKSPREPARPAPEICFITFSVFALIAVSFHREWMCWKFRHYCKVYHEFTYID